MNIDDFVNYLIDKGFNNKQINQLIKIKEAGYNLIEYKYVESNDIETVEIDYIKPTDEVEKLRKLKYVIRKTKFKHSQLIEILNGYKENINYEIYAYSKYNSSQMFKIGYYLTNNINILEYCDESYNEYQMDEVGNGLKNNLDVTIYTNLKYDNWQMYEIKEGLKYNIDITQYNDIKYDDGQMGVLKEILIYNKNNPNKEIGIELFQNEKINWDTMDKLFNILKSNNQNKKIKAYKQLNDYKKNIK
jgi:hypothetical protein